MQSDDRGKIQQVYATKFRASDMQEVRHSFSGVFACMGKVVLFGDTEGFVLVWDKLNGDILCALYHCEGAKHLIGTSVFADVFVDDVIQAAAVSSIIDLLTLAEQR